jgi:hypothetical protein
MEPPGEFAAGQPTMTGLGDIMNYDFSGDAADVRALLAEAADNYFQTRDAGPDLHPPVTRVELALLPGDGRTEPTLYVDFDVRPWPESDGEAQFRCIAELHRPQWMHQLFSPPEGEPLTTTFPDGSSHAPPEGEGTSGYGIDDLVARFLASCLDEAHAGGVFNRISVPPGPKLTVTYDGNPVWEGPGRV